MEFALQHILNLSGTDCAHLASHPACEALFCAFEKDDDPMFKMTLSAVALVSMSACMAGSSAQQVTTRNTAATTQCSGLTGISAMYMNNNHGFATRCGPQTQSPYSYTYR
jgi:hypothetical protein